jgi:hypothetical protein
MRSAAWQAIEPKPRDRLWIADEQALREIWELLRTGARPLAAVLERARRWGKLTGRYVAFPSTCLDRDLTERSWWTDILRGQGYRLYVAGGTRGGFFHSEGELTAALGPVVPVPRPRTILGPGVLRGPGPVLSPHRTAERGHDLAVSIGRTAELERRRDRVLLRTWVQVTNKGETAQPAILTFSPSWDPVRVFPVEAGEAAYPDAEGASFAWEGGPGAEYELLAIVRPLQGDAVPSDNVARVAYRVD